MPLTSAATLLPCLDDPYADDPGSSPRLDDLGLDESGLDESGALAVLGTMVERRLRASPPAPVELDDRGDSVAGAFMKLR